MNQADQDVSPEEHLWKSVVLTMLQDIQVQVLKYKRSLNGVRAVHWSEIQKLKRIAESDHLNLLCDLADINYKVFIKAVDNIIEMKINIQIPRADLFWDDSGQRI